MYKRVTLMGTTKTNINMIIIILILKSTLMLDKMII